MTTPTTRGTPRAPSTSPPQPANLHLLVDGDRVVLTGTQRGDQTHAQLTPRPWLWSRRGAGYVLPRSLLPLTRQSLITELIDRAEHLDLALHVQDSGQTLNETQRRTARTTRLALTADRHAAAAARAGDIAHSAATAARELRDLIPFGQPLMLDGPGPGLLPLCKRLERLDHTASNARQTEARRADLADALHRALERGDSVPTIRQRIERHEAQVRKLARILSNHPADAIPQPLQRLADEHARLLDAVHLDTATLHHLQAAGRAVIYGPDNVHTGDTVNIGGGDWPVVLRVNPSSVTLRSRHGHTGKVRYSKLFDVRRPSALQTGADPVE